MRCLKDASHSFLPEESWPEASHFMRQFLADRQSGS